MNIFWPNFVRSVLCICFDGKWNKNEDQQTEALAIDFVIDLEMYRNCQKMEIFKISIAYYQKSKCFTEIFVSLLYAA